MQIALRHAHEDNENELKWLTIIDERLEKSSQLAGKERFTASGHAADASRNVTQSNQATHLIFRQFHLNTSRNFQVVTFKGRKCSQKISEIQ